MADKNIQVWGARVHNLKNIDVRIPRFGLTVITGLSGSGKSSLAFDTIFAEGQRRYIETFSAYARNFLGGMERPDVDKITGLSPVISIEQKTTNKNPRSTVGTTTEIYDYLRLLFARAGKAYSYVTGEEMVRYSDEKVLDIITNDYLGKKILILAPVIRSRKGHYRELFENFRKKGFLHVRVDGYLQEIEPGMKLDRYKNHRGGRRQDEGGCPLLGLFVRKTPQIGRHGDEDGRRTCDGGRQGFVRCEILFTQTDVSHDGHRL